MNFLQFSMIAGLAAFVFICFIMCLICLGKISKISKSTNIDELSEEIREYYENIKKMSAGSAAAPSYETEFVKIPQSTLCKVGVVHFNAFPDVTGAISFSAAILNRENTGIILTSLYGRDTSNTYMREITNGECDIHLLAEEKKALEKAINSEVI